MNSIELYNAQDVKEIREKLLTEQKFKDLLTGLPLNQKQAVLDHCHKSQYVRAVLDRQSNAVLGKLENLYTQYLSYWYDGSLSDFLRKSADYLDLKHSNQYVHPAWLKRVQIDFGKLISVQQITMLEIMGLPYENCKNANQRKELFKSALLTKVWKFEIIQELLMLVKP